MSQRILAYSIFVVVLIAPIFISPFPDFLLEDTIAVCLAVISVIKFIRKLSLAILSVAVIFVTVVSPILVLAWITGQSLMSELGHFIPDSFDNFLSG